MHTELLKSSLELLQWQRVPDMVAELIKEASGEFPTGKGTFLSELMLMTPSDKPILKDLSPSPLASMLAGAALGGGLGYGLGSIGSMFLPESWDRKKLRRNAMLAGALAGSLPGAEWGALNMIDDQPFNSQHFLKESNVSSGIYTDFNPDEFNQTVWGDPRVANYMKPKERAALTGFVTGAANLPGKRNNNTVTPMDMGRMAMGMGSGYLSGAFVGRALGALMGMPAETQDKLKNIGMWAGLAKSMVPILF